MKTIWSWFGVAVATLLVAGACVDDASSTDLNVAGPPMVEQVRFGEKYMDATSSTIRTRRVFGFGSHPEADQMTEVHEVSRADASDNAFRVIMDELLVGNHIEQIVCRAVVDDDNMDFVPVGSTPDDIAKCSLPNDALVDACPNGPHAVCICHNPAGCTRAGELVAEGDPVGILDADLDGAADKTQMIPGSVGIRCGTIDVPLDYDASYWNPSGNQTVPAKGGFDALGPAIVLVPRLLPTNLDCGLTFAPDITDKSGNAVCAPPLGDITKDCTPGDVSAFKFKTEFLTFSPSPPFMEGQTGVAVTSPVTLETNVPIDPASLTNITITPSVAFMVRGTAMNTAIVIEPTTMWAANTMYTVTIPTTVTDTFGQGAPMATVVHFTTAP